METRIEIIIEKIESLEFDDDGKKIFQYIVEINKEKVLMAEKDDLLLNINEKLKGVIQKSVL